jgi:hypothetical protein
MPPRKALLRRAVAIAKAKAMLADVASGNLDPYEGYRRLYILWCSSNAAVQELRPLFNITGISPDGPLSATDDFRKNVVEISRILAKRFED